MTYTPQPFTDKGDTRMSQTEHYDKLPSRDGRSVIRCHCCRLVQFRSPAGVCVKSGRLLLSGQPEPPQAEIVVINSPPRTPQLGDYDFPFALKLLRIASDLSQRQLAAKMRGVSRTYISKIESGKVEPHVRCAQRSVEALGLTMAEFAAVAQVLGEQVPA